MNARSMVRVGVLGAALVAVVTLAACNGGDKPGADPTSSPKGSASTQPGEQSAAQLTDELYGQTPTTAPAVATVTGKLPRDTWPAKAEIVSVTSSATSTLVVWRLSSADGQQHSVANGGLAPASAHVDHVDSRDLRLIDPSTQQYTEASLYTKEGTTDQKRYCLCANLPTQVTGDPVQLSGLYPPLPSSVTAVDVAIPGFAVAKGVQVTRP